jgi:hypothetical protein
MAAYAWYAGLMLLATAASALARRMARRHTTRTFHATLAAVAGVSAGVMVAMTRGTPWGDFLKAYYPAGEAVLTGRTADLYACEVSNLCFVNLPIVASVFAPLAALSPFYAGMAFTVAGAVAIGLALTLLMPAGALSTRVLWLIVLNGPLYYSLRLGNTTHLLLAPLAATMLMLAGGRDARAGFIFGLLSILKPSLALVLPYLVVRARLRAAAAMAATIAGLALASVAWFGTSIHVTFWRDIVVGFSRAPIAAYNAQSVSGSLAHLLFPGHLRDFEPLPLTTTFGLLRWLVTAVLALVVVVSCWRAGMPVRREAVVVEQSMVVTLALLVAPISWTHYFLLLLAPIAWCASGEIAVRSPRARVGLAGAAVCLSLPVTLFTIPWPRVAAVHERLFASHYFAGAVLLLCVLAYARLDADADRMRLP